MNDGAVSLISLQAKRQQLLRFLARVLLPEMGALFESEDGKLEYAEGKGGGKRKA